MHTFQVVRTEQLAPHMVRVILGGNGFDHARRFVPVQLCGLQAGAVHGVDHAVDARPAIPQIARDDEFGTR